MSKFKSQLERFLFYLALAVLFGGAFALVPAVLAYIYGYLSLPAFMMIAVPSATCVVVVTGVLLTFWTEEVKDDE